MKKKRKSFYSFRIFRSNDLISSDYNFEIATRDKITMAHFINGSHFWTQKKSTAMWKKLNIINEILYPATAQISIRLRWKYELLEMSRTLTSKSRYFALSLFPRKVDEISHNNETLLLNAVCVKKCISRIKHSMWSLFSPADASSSSRWSSNFESPAEFLSLAKMLGYIRPNVYLIR